MRLTTHSALPPSSRLELTFVETMRDPFLIVDEGLRVTYVNACGREYLAGMGRAPGALVGGLLRDVVPQLASTAAEQEMRDAWQRSAPLSLAYNDPQASRQFEVDVMRHGESLGLFFRDITGRRGEPQPERAGNEASFAPSHPHFDELMAGAPLAIIVLDNDERVLTWNPAAEKMFQWTADEVLGQHLPNIPDDERSALEAIQASGRSDEPLQAMPARRRRKDGVVLDVQVSTSPLRDASDKVIGVVGMVADVTEQRRLEAQLRAAHKMEAVGLLAGGVAHDFNNLLTAIKGFSSLLQMTIPRGGQATEFLAEIDKAADRAAGLTAQLLAFSRRQLLRPEPLDLNARVRDLERMLRLLVRENGELVLELDPRLGLVLADPGQVEQVVMNLVVNARDAIQDRAVARVTLRTANVALAHEFTGWGVEAAPGPYVRLDVIDTGIGMDASTKARIFDPFFTTKGPGRGSGLGLGTVYGIVKQSGGYIWVESAPGAGSTFSVYLPRALDSARVVDPPAAESGATARVVLLVEDEDAVRRVARRALELHGYEVLDASGGAEAIAIAEGRAIDVLLTDVMMPGMVGPAVAEALRRRLPALPVVFMSGHSDDAVRAALLSARSSFLAKPFTPSQLVESVKGALGGVGR